MRIQDIFVSIIVLSLTIITILLQYNLVKVYEFKYEVVPLELFVFAGEMHMEKFLYSQYLSSNDPNYLFYFDPSIKDNISYYKDIKDLYYCLENCSIKKYFSISCGEVTNVTDVNIDNDVIKIKRYEFCFAPAFVIEELSSYLGDEHKKYILSIYNPSSIIPHGIKLKIYSNYSELLEAMSNLKEGDVIATDVFNAKIPILLTDKYGRLYKIHPISISTIKLIETSTIDLKG